LKSETHNKAARQIGVTFRLFLAACLLLILSVTANAQGGFGGGGQGGGGGFGGAGGGFGGGGQGGGFGGSQGPTGDIYANPSQRPVDRDLTDPFWQERTAILTPGDRVEFLFTLKKGETVLAGVTSEAFDPAISVVTAKGKELEKNDDRREGNQSPFINFKAPSDGDYLLKVLSYRSVAGGKFVIRMRTIFPVESAFGELNNVPTNPQSRETNRRISFRIPVKKGETYNVGYVYDQSDPYWNALDRVQVYGPTGIPAEDYRAFSDGFAGLIEAKFSGDLIVEYRARKDSTVKTNFQRVPVQQVKTQERLSRLVPQKEFVRIEMPVKKYDIVRSSHNWGHSMAVLTAQDETETRKYNLNADGKATKPWFAIQNRAYSEDDVTRIFQYDETIIYLFRNIWDQSTNLELNNVSGLPELTSGRAVSAKLAIGDQHVYRTKVAKSEFVRYGLKEVGFLPEFEIYTFDGQKPEHQYRDGEIYYPAASEYIVKVACSGHGGSGSYELKRDTILPVKLGLTESVSIASKDDLNLFYSVDLEAGKSYEVLFEGTMVVDLTVINAEGDVIKPQSIGTPDQNLHLFSVWTSGPHRLWIRQYRSADRFQIRPHKGFTFDRAVKD